MNDLSEMSLEEKKESIQQMCNPGNFLDIKTCVVDILKLLKEQSDAIDAHVKIIEDLEAKCSVALSELDTAKDVAEQNVIVGSFKF